MPKYWAMMQHRQKAYDYYELMGEREAGARDAKWHVQSRKKAQRPPTDALHPFGPGTFISRLTSELPFNVADQAGGKHRGVGLVGADIGFGVVCRSPGLKVANDSVGPEIRNFDLYGVSAGFEPTIYSKGKWIAPDGAGVVTVDADAGDLANAVEAKPDFVGGLVIWGDDRSEVDGCAGKITHAGNRALSPASQLRKENTGRRCAAIWLEGNGPRCKRVQHLGA